MDEIIDIIKQHKLAAGALASAAVLSGLVSAKQRELRRKLKGYRDAENSILPYYRELRKQN